MHDAMRPRTPRTSSGGKRSGGKEERWGAAVQAERRWHAAKQRRPQHTHLLQLRQGLLAHPQRVAVDSRCLRGVECGRELVLVVGSVGGEAEALRGLGEGLGLGFRFEAETLFLESSQLSHPNMAGGARWEEGGDGCEGGWQWV
jgi:hypothetical protein